MKKLVIEIDLDAIDGQRGDVLGLLTDIAEGVATYPHDDLRTEDINGFMSSRFTEAGDKEALVSANVTASVDVVDGEMLYTNVSDAYHRRQDAVQALFAKLGVQPES